MAGGASHYFSGYVIWLSIGWIVFPADDWWRLMPFRCIDLFSFFQIGGPNSNRFQPWRLLDWVLQGFTTCPLHCNEFYRVLPGFTGFHWVLLGYIGFYWIWMGFTRLLPGFTGFYRVSTGSDWFWPSFLWIYCVWRRSNEFFLPIEWQIGAFCASVGCGCDRR